MIKANQKKAQESWLKFLNPESLRSNLLSASLYLAAYEVLQSSVIDQIKSFFTTGWSPAGATINPRYSQDVLSLHKSPFRASALWLQTHGVLDSTDLGKLDLIREHRNAIAHDLPKFVASTDAEVDANLFQNICDLVTKIDQWWIAEVEIPTNSDFDDKDVDFAGVQSGNMIFLHLLIQIATGAAEDPAFYYSEFKKRITNDT